MKKKNFSNLNVTYFHRYHMVYGLISSFIKLELDVEDMEFRPYDTLASLLRAVQQNTIDIVFVHSCCLLDGGFKDAEIHKLLSVLSESKRVVTVLFAQSLRAELLKKLMRLGMDVVVSPYDTPKELITAILHKLNNPDATCYISKKIEGQRYENPASLTIKEWEVINLIGQGYSLTEISAKKSRAMSTISTQKRNAMNKLNLKNESELLHFLHRNTLF